MTALDKLIETVEAGTLDSVWHGCSSRRGHWAYSAGLDATQRNLAWQASHGSLDAALALHEALLPGWVFRITGGGPMPLSGDYRIPHVHVFKPRMTEDDKPLGANSSGFDCDAPARAWLLAILRAYRSLRAAE